MTTNQQFSTRIGVRHNLRVVSTRLLLDINTFRKVETLYLTAKPQISEAARLCRETAQLLDHLVEELRGNI